jgi:hypothetical protein
MIRFLKNLFLSPEERIIRKIVSTDSGVSAAIIVVRMVPMSGMVERAQFERLEETVSSSARRFTRTAEEQITPATISPDTFDQLLRALKSTAKLITSADARGVKDGQSFRILWSELYSTGGIFVRWPVNNVSVKQVLDALLPTTGGPSDSPPPSTRRG